MASHVQIGELLVRHRIITQEQLTTALELQQSSSLRLGQALQRLNYCTEVEVARAVAEQQGILFVDLHQTPPTRDALRHLPRALAVKHGLVPVRVDGGRLVVAARNPFDIAVDDIVRKASGMSVVIAAAAEPQIDEVLDNYDDFRYPTLRANGTASTARSQAAAPVLNAAASKELARLHSLLEHPVLVRRVNVLLAEAVRRNATNLTLEPDGEGLRAIARIDGVSYLLPGVPAPLGRIVQQRVKAISGLSLQRSSLGEQGSGQVRVDGRTVDLRVTAIPVLEGEALCLRIADPAARPPALEELGMDGARLARLTGLLHTVPGLSLFAAPAGHGRPTTLYGLTDWLRRKGAYPFLLESTIERRLRNVNQVEIDGRCLHRFAGALEMVLGVHPDYIVVGELPDPESVKLICRAGATGQRVISGSHSPDAVSALYRLCQHGISMADVAAAVVLITAQRLARRICTECTQPYTIPFALQKRLAAAYPDLDPDAWRRGKGCPACFGLGTRGCIGIFETLVLTEEHRQALASDITAEEFRNLLEREGHLSLEAEAVRLAQAGIILPEEIERVALLPSEPSAAGQRLEVLAPLVHATLMGGPGTEADDDAELGLDLAEPESWDEVAAMVGSLTGV